MQCKHLRPFGKYIYLSICILKSLSDYKVCQEGSSWVEPVLSKDKCLAKDTTQ